MGGDAPRAGASAANSFRGLIRQRAMGPHLIVAPSPDLDLLSRLRQPADKAVAGAQMARGRRPSQTPNGAPQGVDQILQMLAHRLGVAQVMVAFQQAVEERLLRRAPHRLGRTLLVTNRRDWTAEQVVAASAGQQQMERVFRGLKEGDWLNWQPLHHGTESKIRVHAFYCLLGLSLLHDVHRQAQCFWTSITIEKLQEELEQIQQFVLLYRAQGAGPYRIATVISTQNLIQKGLTKTLGLQQLGSTPRG